MPGWGLFATDRGCDAERDPYLAVLIQAAGLKMPADVVDAMPLTMVAVTLPRPHSPLPPWNYLQCGEEPPRRKILGGWGRRCSLVLPRPKLAGCCAALYAIVCLTRDLCRHPNLSGTVPRQHSRKGAQALAAAEPKRRSPCHPEWPRLSSIQTLG